MNRYTGDMPVEVDGQRLTLAYTWTAIARIRSELGDDGQARALAGDLPSLAAMVSIGLAQHHPEWDMARIHAASPPIIPTMRAVEAALEAAWFGPDGLPKEVPPENPPVPPRTLFGSLWRRLTGRG